MSTISHSSISADRARLDAAPAFHSVFHPGGHVPDQNSPAPGATIKDAAVNALRSVIVY